MQFQIDNMNCGGCAKSVTKAIQSVDGQAKVEIDLAGKQVLVASSAAEAAILASLNDLKLSPSTGGLNLAQGLIARVRR